MKNKLLFKNKPNQAALQQQILKLKTELKEIEEKTGSFERTISDSLSDLIVETQELNVLYKQIKKAKKEKRLAQKKRGKNYQEPVGLIKTTQKEKQFIQPEEQKEKKRLYREAMLHVHPDKFFMNECETEIATEITSKLIKIYKTENLEALRAYHAHIFSGNMNITLGEAASNILVSDTSSYLAQEKDKLEKAIIKAKANHLYKVVTEYENPLTFVVELKDYYERRIFQLKKRTRKGL